MMSITKTVVGAVVFLAIGLGIGIAVAPETPARNLCAHPALSRCRAVVGAPEDSRRY